MHYLTFAWCSLFPLSAPSSLCLSLSSSSLPPSVCPSLPPLFLLLSSPPFLHRFAPQTINDPSFNHIVSFILLIVCTPHYFKNPYLLTKVIEVMFIMTPGITPGEGNTLDMFLSHPLASGQLAKSLINIYIGEQHLDS